MPRGAWGVLVWAGDAGMGGVRVVGSKVGLGVGVDQRGGAGDVCFLVWDFAGPEPKVAAPQKLQTKKSAGAEPINKCSYLHLKTMFFLVCPPHNFWSATFSAATFDLAAPQKLQTR